VDERGRDDADSQPLLILRRMPPERHHLARPLTVDGVSTATSTWWELVDAAAADDTAPAGVALTDVGPDGAVTVLALGAEPAEAVVTLPELLTALVAVLRSHPGDVVLVRSTDQFVVRALLEVGFSRAPAGGGYVLAL
jgi:hypothetical protein